MWNWEHVKAFRENQPEDLSRPCAAATLEAGREKSAFVAQRKVSSGDTYSKRLRGGGLQHKDHSLCWCCHCWKQGSLFYGDQVLVTWWWVHLRGATRCPLWFKLKIKINKCLTVCISWNKKNEKIHRPVQSVILRVLINKESLDLVITSLELIGLKELWSNHPNQCNQLNLM